MLLLAVIILVFIFETSSAASPEMVLDVNRLKQRGDKYVFVQAEGLAYVSGQAGTTLLNISFFQFTVKICWALPSSGKTLLVHVERIL